MAGRRSARGLGTPDRSTADLVAGFTAGFTQRTLTEHGVVSGLGVWLLLALLAPGAPGPARTVLEEALGTDAPDAAARAAELLDNAHPDVAQALAVWAQRVLLTPAFDRWAAGLPGAVARGAMPTQEQADTWTAQETRGLIGRFPITLRPLTGPSPTAVVLTSALATQIRWSTLFDLADEPLGGAFVPAQPVLSSRPQHDVRLTDTVAAGRVAVHTAWSDGGLRVLSVIAEPGRTVGDVHQAALEAVGSPGVDLFDVPLGAGHAWTLDESVKTMVSRTDRSTTTHALLPTWKAATDLDLSGEPWFAAAVATMQPWVTEPDGLEGRQSAVASYDQTGFSAAAVTAFGVRGASAYRPQPRRQVRIRHLEVRFDRPYAVVAVADLPSRPPNPRLDHWNGIPVFSAWVANPR
ncbi:MAG: hypothetical protein FWH11_15030 [Micrococcales bacterium]|nr:hypothetical protein [Micrococcales bacterium]